MEYKWSISGVEYDTTQEELTAINVHWRFNLTDKELTVGTYGCVSLDPPSEEFIKQEELTQKVVVSWLKNKLDVKELRQNLKSQLEEKKKPKTVTLPLKD